MKTININVPRMLVKNYLPHPEFYGEALVELVNGMITDVFTEDTFNLITQTNNLELIKFLRNNQIEDISYSLLSGVIHLRSINQTNIDQVHEWMNEGIFNEYKYTKNDIKLFVSHSISRNSHLFLIEINSIEIGLAGYDVIDSSAIININIFNRLLNSENEYLQLIQNLMNHILNNHHVFDLIAIVKNDDLMLKDAFSKNQFVKTSQSVSDHEIALRLYIIEPFITEEERNILIQFFQIRPEKLFFIASQDDLVDIDHSIDYTLKTYISLIFSNQLHRKDEYETIFTEDDGKLSIEENLIMKYDDTMAKLSDNDLVIAKHYRELIYPVLNIINNQINLYVKKQKSKLIKSI